MGAQGRLAALIAALPLLLVLLSAPARAQQGGPFSDWAAVVVAGDWHAHSGGPSEAFDNARRDVSSALERAGFAPAAAAELAGRFDVDLHRAVDLLQKGCPPDVALSILR